MPIWQIRYDIGQSARRLFIGMICWLTASLVVFGQTEGRGQMLVEMPGESYSGPLPELTKDQKELADQLRRHVDVLAKEIGERNLVRRPDELAKTADYIEGYFRESGLEPDRQTFRVGEDDCHNLVCEIASKDSDEEVIVVGAHYDSVSGCPAANDNGSGVAALLALGEILNDVKSKRTLRLVAFTNEETPYFGSDAMGSLVYARSCRERNDKIVGMISLETIGYFSDKPDSQKYPPPFSQFYPSTGNYIGFVGDVESSQLVERCVASFRKHAKFPSEGGALPRTIDGVGWSDHWAFWQQDYPALMVTDTAPFRYPHYHRATDTPDKLDYELMARVVEGVRLVILDLLDD